jgi:hypothetical protein
VSVARSAVRESLLSAIVRGSREGRADTRQSRRAPQVTDKLRQPSAVTTTISYARPRVGDRPPGLSDVVRRQVAEFASGSAHSLAAIGDLAPLGGLAELCLL